MSVTETLLPAVTFPVGKSMSAPTGTAPDQVRLVVVQAQGSFGSCTQGTFAAIGGSVQPKGCETTGVCVGAGTAVAGTAVGFTTTTGTLVGATASAAGALVGATATEVGADDETEPQLKLPAVTSKPGTSRCPNSCSLTKSWQG